jgi:hypothetical protein
MAASLTLSWINDPTGIGTAVQDLVQRSLQNAFAAWLGHFDAPQGNVVLTVNFSDLGRWAATAAPSGNTVVGMRGGTPVMLSAFGAQIGFGGPGGSAAAVLDISTSWLMDTFPSAATPYPVWQGDDVRVFEHELGHALGLDVNCNWTTGAPSTWYQTTYDQYVQVTDGQAVFTGPNADAAFGAPVPLETGSGFHPYVGGKISVMSYLDSAQSIQTLDVDLLKDAGLPILTDREVDEHALVRLYAAAFDRAADPTEIINALNTLRTGASLHDVALGLVTTAEFGRAFGSNPSNEVLVAEMYQQVLHRTPDASEADYWVRVLDAGLTHADLLVQFAESDENRQALETAPNVSYAATTEQEVARLYEAAMQRGADPGGFAYWTTALVNGDTLGHVATQFISSPEFATHYGRDTTNDTFVTTLYANVLGRTPDHAGNAGWVEALTKGVSRADVLLGFSDSHESILRTAAGATIGPAGNADTAFNVPLGMIPVHWIE